MVIFQGGSSTLIAGVIALGYNKPVLSCSGFGGMAVKLTSVLAEKGAIAPEEKARLEVRPREAAPDWAKECVEILLKQAEKIDSKRQQQAINAASVKRRQAVHTLLAASMATIALILCILNWDNSLRLPPDGVRGVIFLVAGLSGATGALLRSIVPFLRAARKDTLESPWGTVALGLIVGLVSTLIYLVAQEHGFPELKGTVLEEKISELKADYCAQLTPVVMITALVAGMTLDSTFKSLLKRRFDEP
jgi:hypothetical protein